MLQHRLLNFVCTRGQTSYLGKVHVGAKFRVCLRANGLVEMPIAYVNIFNYTYSKPNSRPTTSSAILASLRKASRCETSYSPHHVFTSLPTINLPFGKPYTLRRTDFITTVHPFCSSHQPRARLRTSRWLTPLTSDHCHSPHPRASTTSSHVSVSISSLSQSMSVLSTELPHTTTACAPCQNTKNSNSCPRASALTQAR